MTTMTPADKAAIYTIELVMGLDKRTKNYHKAVEALALINEIRRSEAGDEELEA